MKKKWKQLSVFERKMVIFIGLVNVVVLAVQFIAGFSFSWWMAGIGNGAYISFLLDVFGRFGSRRSSTFVDPVPDPEVSGNE